VFVTSSVGICDRAALWERRPSAVTGAGSERASGHEAPSCWGLLAADRGGGGGGGGVSEALCRYVAV